jgi:hypothetical protein
VATGGYDRGGNRTEELQRPGRFKEFSEQGGSGIRAFVGEEEVGEREALYVSGRAEGTGKRAQYGRIDSHESANGFSTDLRREAMSTRYGDDEESVVPAEVHKHPRGSKGRFRRDRMGISHPED